MAAKCIITKNGNIMSFQDLKEIMIKRNCCFFFRFTIEGLFYKGKTNLIKPKWSAKCNDT